MSLGLALTAFAERAANEGNVDIVPVLSTYFELPGNDYFDLSLKCWACDDVLYSS